MARQKKMKLLSYPHHSDPDSSHNEFSMKLRDLNVYLDSTSIQIESEIYIYNLLMMLKNDRLIRSLQEISDSILHPFLSLQESD